MFLDQQISICRGSCDTEDKNNDAEKLAFITDNKYACVCVCVLLNKILKKKTLLHYKQLTGVFRRQYE